ncbi:MAG: protein phosphatase CheZ [Emcibacter sp.]|nr:protein phosphatase CheZ [Emcibacter sp.]
MISLENKIENIRKKMGDQVNSSDISDIIGRIMEALQVDINQQGTHFQDEVRDLLHYINQARIDLIDIKPKYLSEKKIPEASDHLDQIIMATEVAASKIMDAAEEISELSGTVDDVLSEKLMRISTDIFEASSFQDITGQRVTKVITTLKHLEEKLAALADAIGDTDSHIKIKEEEDKLHPESKEKLLQGPQCAITGNDQDDIDALFDSFD